ncbi:MAG: membrane protein insertase YidC [Bacteroidales bacterium]|nr:membrane protein insertase YidC [Bacteroidales bacterium]
MDKNSIIGFVLIGLILVGFTFYQSKQAKEAARYQRQLDSAKAVEAILQYKEDSLLQAQREQNAPIVKTEGASTPAQASRPVYQDAALESASHGEGEFLTLENDKLQVVISTRGAQPHSVMVKDYQTYDSTALYLVSPGKAKMGVNVYAGEYINTADFVFQVVSADERSIVLELPFSGGGAIRQAYTLEEGSYLLADTLSFLGCDRFIPRRVASFDLEWNNEISRFEKSYKNEKQYSKAAYWFEGESGIEEFAESKDGAKKIDASVKWIAFQQQFFSTILTSGDRFAAAEVEARYADDKDPEGRLMLCKARLRHELDRSKGEDVVVPLSLYFGPGDYNLLRSYNLNYEKLVPVGGWLVGWINRFIIIPFFHFLHGLSPTSVSSSC